MQLAPVDAYIANRMDIGFRNRSSALLDLDHLLGVVLDGIEALGVADSTYVIFTSDNGFHMGEHRMLFGKEHPYETDVSLPFYVRGPGVPAGAVLQYATTHIDITATIVELAGATPVGPELDGLSFAAAFSASPPAPVPAARARAAASATLQRAPGGSARPFALVVPRRQLAEFACHPRAGRQAR